MERFTVSAVVAAAAVLAAAVAVPGEARTSQDLPCRPPDSYEPPPGSFASPLSLRVSSVPEQLTADSVPTWVLTLSNRTRRARTLGFVDTQFAEVELWWRGRNVYRWSDGRAFYQALWAWAVPGRSTWRCTLPETRPLRLAPGRYTLVAFLGKRSGSRLPRHHRQIVID